MAGTRLLSGPRLASDVLTLEEDTVVLFPDDSGHGGRRTRRVRDKRQARLVHGTLHRCRGGDKLPSESRGRIAQLETLLDPPPLNGEGNGHGDSRAVRDIIHERTEVQRGDLEERVISRPGAQVNPD